MNEANDNPYKSPSATLVEKNGGSKKVFQFKRFTAWAVFGLALITLGIYTVYWLYSRANTANAVHDNKIEKGWITGFVVVYVIYLISSFAAGNSSAMAMVLLISSIAYLVTYIGLVFSLKNRLQEMMNEGGDQVWKLNGVLTFLFSAIYLQYKINEYFDTQRVNA